MSFRRQKHTTNHSVFLSASKIHIASLYLLVLHPRSFVGDMGEISKRTKEPLQYNQMHDLLSERQQLGPGAGNIMS